MSAGTADFFYKEAQRLGYLARSAFKLLQMQKQYKLIKPGSSVLDFGCAPGAWLQVACQSLGPLKTGGVVVGIDLKKVKVPSTHCDERVQTICDDVMNIERNKIRELSPQGKGFSVILSDMCPSVSGIPTRDAALSIELGTRAVELAVGEGLLVPNDGEDASNSSNGDADVEGVLRPGGNLVIKLLESEDIKELGDFCKPRFKKASLLRPKATRAASREIYLICQGLVGGTKETSSKK